MKTYRDFDLYKHNTMHLHCIASNVFIPENEGELLDLLSSIRTDKKEFRILGACSNVVLPRLLKTPVILLTSFNKELNESNGIIEVGASVRVQHLIREAQKMNLGGIEYLFSVPCTIGGATVMNAGRGNGKQSIGNYVKQVRCLNTDSGVIEVLNKEDCCFSYRNSVFLKGNRIILSVIIQLEEKSPEKIEDGINERKRYALEYLDDRRPSCGSIFKTANSRILKIMRGLRIGEAEWSPKTNNWVSNRGNAKNWNVRLLISIACILHVILLKPYKLEVEIWKR